MFLLIIPQNLVQKSKLRFGDISERQSKNQNLCYYDHFEINATGRYPVALIYFFTEKPRMNESHFLAAPRLTRSDPVASTARGTSQM